MIICPIFETERDTVMFNVMVAYADDTSLTAYNMSFQHLEDVLRVSDIQGWCDFIARNRKGLSKYRLNIVGCFFERLIKDFICMTHDNIHIFDNGVLRLFPQPNVCYGKGKADFTFVKNEDEKEIPYVMSVKTSSLSSNRKSIGITKSELSAELGKENEIVVSKKEQGIKPRMYFAADVPVTSVVDMAKSLTVSDVEELTIIYPLRKMLTERTAKVVEEYNAKPDTTCKIRFRFLEDMYTEIRSLMSNHGMSAYDLFSSHYMTEDFVLRSCQENMVNRIMDVFSEYSIAVMEAFCRFGKTVTGGAVYKKLFGEDFRGKVLYYVSYYPDNFYTQAEDFYKVFGGGENVLIHDLRAIKNVDNLVFDETRLNVVFVSVQNISRRAKKFVNEVKKMYGMADGFIFDETHQGINSDTQNECLTYLPKDCKSLYITATPYSPMFHGLPKATFSILDKIELDCWSKDMYDNPIVIPYEYKTRTIDGKTYKIADVREYMKDSALFKAAIMGILNLGSNGISTKNSLKAVREFTGKRTLYSDAEARSYLSNFLMPCEDIEMADTFYEWLTELAKEHPALKLRVDKSTSQSAFSKNVTKRINKFFENRNYINIFIVVDQGTVGSTIKNLDACIFMKNTVSVSRYLQIFGRCYERTKDKNGKTKRFTYFFDMVQGRALKMSVSNLHFMTNNNPTPKQTRFISKLFGVVDGDEVVYPSEKDVIEMMTEIRDAMVSNETSFDAIASNIVFTEEIVNISTTPYNITKNVVVYQYDVDNEAEATAEKVVVSEGESKSKDASKDEDVTFFNEQRCLKLRCTKELNEVVNLCIGVSSEDVRDNFLAGNIDQFDFIRACLKKKVGRMTVEEYIYG